MKKLPALFLVVVMLMSISSALAECIHEWNADWNVEKPSTCTDPGVRWTECKLCGERKEEKLPLADHIWSYKANVAPTCIEPGYFDRYCTVCKLHEEGKLLPLADHTWRYEKNVAPTCIEPGYFDRYCTVCKLHEEEKISALGHVPGDWIVTREPTRTKAGERIIVCTVCSFLIKIEAIPALGLTNHPAAPAIAAQLLKAAGIAPNYDTGFVNPSGKPVYENYISQVADYMGPGTDFNGVAKTQDPAYKNAVREYLNTLGAGI